MPPKLLRPVFAVALFLSAAAAILLGPSGCARAPRKAEADPPPQQVRPETRPAARVETTGYPFTRAERAAVEEFLRRNPGLRVATDEDRRRGADSDAELRGLYGVYHPYFVRGDLDDDGVLDFVLAFVRKDSARSAPWFSVVVFTGRTTSDGGAFSAGTFLERDVSIARGDLAVDRDAVVITPDLGDDNVRRYKWDVATRSFLFVRDDDSDQDSPVVSQTRQRVPASPRVRTAAGAGAVAL
ncbi:MAG TPA: hypothetical protein VE007_11455 [Thermoanaerobaculia bacterium]|nr:hypothetical protein [Thermoanaerobaculia bacterium]